MDASVDGMATMLSLEFDGKLPVKLGNAIRTAIAQAAFALDVDTDVMAAIVARSYGVKIEVGQ